MKILFVHTPMGTVSVPERKTFWENLDRQYHATHPNLQSMETVLWELPHWMHWLAGVLVAAGFDDLDVLDLYTSTETVNARGQLNARSVESVIRAGDADVFLFSPMTVNLHLALEIAEIVKSCQPGATTIFGGVVATPLIDRVARYDQVDYVVSGRGEHALPELLGALTTGKDVTEVGQLTYVAESGELFSSAGMLYPAVQPHELAFPKIDLFPPSAGRSIRYIRQVYALGCPYKCSFCTIETIGQKPKYFPIDRLLSEINAYRGRYGQHHHLYWGDETFTLHRERTLTLARALEEVGGIEYDCQTRLNCLGDTELLEGLQRSGCRWIEIGIETNSQASHDRHKNRMKLAEVEETLKRVRDAGLAACSYGVNGFPEQTADEMKRSGEWLAELISRDLLQASYLAQLVPYPGSEMYAQPEKFGMELLHHDYSRYGEDQLPVYKTALAEPDEVYECFTQSLSCIAEAMGKTPYFESAAPAWEPKEYGSFWSSTHV